MKNNLWIKITIPALVFASGYGVLQFQVKDTVGEVIKLEERIDKDIKEVKEEHDKDIEGISGKLETLVNLAQQQMTQQSEFNGVVKTTLEFMAKDIEEIKAR